MITTEVNFAYIIRHQEPPHQRFHKIWLAYHAPSAVPNKSIVTDKVGEISRDCNLLSLLGKYGYSVPRLARAATWARARARGAGLSRTHQHTATCPLKGLRDPEDMAME